MAAAILCVALAAREQQAGGRRVAAGVGLALLAAVVLKERIGGAQRAGVLLTLAGIVLISA
jgi:drug/metabolite transporter (DMT)-like permease